MNLLLHKSVLIDSLDKNLSFFSRVCILPLKIFDERNYGALSFIGMNRFGQLFSAPENCIGRKCQSRAVLENLDPLQDKR
jgi:hypothetical protein